MLDRRVDQVRNLSFGLLLPSRHLRLLGFDPGRPSDPGQGFDQGAALDAEGAVNSSLGGGAVEDRATVTCLSRL